MAPIHSTSPAVCLLCRFGLYWMSFGPKCMGGSSESPGETRATTHNYNQAVGSPLPPPCRAPRSGAGPWDPKLQCKHCTNTKIMPHTALSPRFALVQGAALVLNRKIGVQDMSAALVRITVSTEYRASTS